MGFFFTFFYQPVANILFFMMSLIGTDNLGVGILAMVIFIKMLLLPISVKNTHFQMRIQTITDDLKRIREKEVCGLSTKEKSEEKFRKE